MLYYRSRVYEAMDEKAMAKADAERALAIAEALDLPFVDLLRRRVEELGGAR